MAKRGISHTVRLLCGRCRRKLGEVSLQREPEDLGRFPCDRCGAEWRTTAARLADACAQAANGGHAVRLGVDC